MEKRMSSSADAEAQADAERLRSAASRNALSRLVRCLFAERLLEPDALLWARDGDQAWLPLWQLRRVLHFSDLRRAPARTFQNRGSVEVLDETGARRRIDDPSELIDQVASVLAITPASSSWRNLRASNARDINGTLR